MDGSCSRQSNDARREQFSVYITHLTQKKLLNVNWCRRVDKQVPAEKKKKKTEFRESAKEKCEREWLGNIRKEKRESGKERLGLMKRGNKQYSEN